MLKSSSTQLHRRRKQAWTSGLYLDRLLTELVRFDQGEPSFEAIVFGQTEPGELEIIAELVEVLA